MFSSLWPYDRSLGSVLRFFRLQGTPLAPFLMTFGSPRGSLGRLWGPLGAIWAPLWLSWPTLGPLGCHLGCFGQPLGTIGFILRHSGGPLGSLWWLLASTWDPGVPLYMIFAFPYVCHSFLLSSYRAKRSRARPF